MQIIPPTTLVPRFILNLREIYARDLEGRRGSDIDVKAFGLGSGFERGAIRRTIEFAEHRQNESEEPGDEMEMEIREVGRTNGLVWGRWPYRLYASACYSCQTQSSICDSATIPITYSWTLCVPSFPCSVVFPSRLFVSPTFGFQSLNGFSMWRGAKLDGQKL